MNIISPQANPALGKAAEENNAKKAGTSANPSLPPANSAYYKDSIASLDALDGEISGVKNKVVRKGLGFLSKAVRKLVTKTESKKNNHEANKASDAARMAASDPLPMRPSLVSPNVRTSKALLEMSASHANQKKETNKLPLANDTIKKQEEATDHLKAIISLMAAHARFLERQSQLYAENINLTAEENEALMKEYQQNKDEAAKLKAKSDILGWTGFGAALLGGIFTIGGLIATAFSGGVALPAVLAIGSGLAGVASGGSNIAGSVFRDQSESSEIKSIEAKHFHTLNTNQMQDNMQKSEEYDSNWSNFVSSMAQLIKNIPHLFK